MIVQSEYSPYHILLDLSSNNIHEYSAMLNGNDYSSTIPVNHWLGNPGRLDLMEYAYERAFPFSALLTESRRRRKNCSRNDSGRPRSCDEQSIDRRTLPQSPASASTALALARAMKKTIRAEKNLAFERIVETELRLKTRNQAGCCGTTDRPCHGHDERPGTSSEFTGPQT